MTPRGQVSFETILGMGFVIIVVTSIMLPYVSQQNVSNALTQAKLAMLPLIEKNRAGLKITNMEYEVIPTPTDLEITARTTGTLDPDTLDALQVGGKCVEICQAAKAGTYYTSITYTWENTPSFGLPYAGICADVSC